MDRLSIRLAQATDVPLMLEFIRELAVYEREPSAVKATETDLLRDGFQGQPRFYCMIALWEGKAAGFALYFPNYSTWEGKPGMHLEDLFVREPFRGLGIGKGLLLRVARHTFEQGYTRLNWHVLKWNQPAIDFYLSLGAKILDEWSICRLTPQDLEASGGDPR